MMRKLTGLTEDKYINPGKLNIHFAYYEEDEAGRLEWNHTWDECLITFDQLYDVLKPFMTRKEVT